MLLPTSYHTTTADEVNLLTLPCEIAKALQIYRKAFVTHSFFSKIRGEEGICLAILVLYHPCVVL